MFLKCQNQTTVYFLYIIFINEVEFSKAVIITGKYAHHIKTSFQIYWDFQLSFTKVLC